jgi:D-aminoacyl-tRNA deacylase
VEPERYLLVLSDEDPVVTALLPHLGPPGPVESSASGVMVRRAAPGVQLVHRPGHHIFDEQLDRKLPEAVRAARIPLVFPSVHRSGQGVRSLTVHALGNFGPEAELGGEPGRLVPAAPRLMTDALRRLAEIAGPLGLRATFEATHHGPSLELPAFFVEIGYAEDPAPPADAVAALARILCDFAEDPRDRVAVGAGGGHYAPHFTDLALERRWAFGHIISKHSLAVAAPATLRSAMAMTPGAEGVLFHRAADAEEGPARELGPRLVERSQERRLGGPA